MGPRFPRSLTELPFKEKRRFNMMSNMLKSEPIMQVCETGSAIHIRNVVTPPQSAGSDQQQSSDDAFGTQSSEDAFGMPNEMPKEKTGSLEMIDDFVITEEVGEEQEAKIPSIAFRDLKDEPFSSSVQTPRLVTSNSGELTLHDTTLPCTPKLSFPPPKRFPRIIRKSILKQHSLLKPFYADEQRLFHIFSASAILTVLILACCFQLSSKADNDATIVSALENLAVIDFSLLIVATSGAGITKFILV